MKKLFIYALLVVAMNTRAQKDSAAFKNVIHFDKTLRTDLPGLAALHLEPKAITPSDPAFNITDDKLLHRLFDKFDYWSRMFEGDTTTLVIYPKRGQNTFDSLLVTENPENRFSFLKTGEMWHIQNFTIRSMHITINQIRVGMTSKEVFGFLKLKTRKEVGNGQVWVSSSDGKSRLIVSFSNNKVTSIQL